MATVIALECDQCRYLCEKHAYAPSVHPNELYSVPDTWLTLFVGDPQGQVPRHFCTKECAQEWLQNGHGRYGIEE